MSAKEKYSVAILPKQQMEKLNTAYNNAKTAASTVALLDAIASYVKLICSDDCIRQFVIENVGLALNDGSIASDNIKFYRTSMQRYNLVCRDTECETLSSEERDFINAYKSLLNDDLPIKDSIISHNGRVIINAQQDADKIVLFHEQLFGFNIPNFFDLKVNHVLHRVHSSLYIDNTLISKQNFNSYNDNFLNVLMKPSNQGRVIDKKEMAELMRMEQKQLHKFTKTVNELKIPKELSRFFFVTSKNEIVFWPNSLH